MNLDLTVTISVIIALCAIVSPVIVAAINSWRKMKIKEIEVAAAYKFKAFENYLGSLEQYIRDPNKHNEIEYNKSFGVALLYASKNAQNCMTGIDTNIKNSNFEFIPREINELCIELQRNIGI